MKRLLLLSLFAFASVVADTLPEVTQQPEPTVEWDATGEYKATFFRTLFLIIGVILVVLIAVWVLKRMALGKPMVSNHYRNIKILERRPLSPQTILYQIEIGGRQVIIAESKVDVRVLTQFDTLDKGL
jgi:flagellar protein FliO/FliZ